MSIILPDLTRLERARDRSPPELQINAAFEEFYRYKFSTYEIGEAMDKLFRRSYSFDDAVYRRDFLGDLLDVREQKRAFDKVFSALPSRDPKPVRVRDEWGSLLPESIILYKINCIKKHIALPDTLELMSVMPGASEGMRDLHRFAKRARRMLAEYEVVAAPLKQASQFVDKKSLDMDWANDCLDKIEPFVATLSEIRKIKWKMLHYKSLCIPYEAVSGGRRIPSCKPQFLDPDRRECHIVNAYNPAHFARDKKRDDKKTKITLNVPNDVNWDENARGNFVQGPNSMGKSVYIRTIGLNVHLAMAGLYCFADSCELSLPGRIFACFDLGDTLRTGHFETGADSLDDMLGSVRRNDLVLLDEVGGGTEPAVEREISMGVSEGLLMHGITFFHITHDKGTWMNYANVSGVQMLRVADLKDKARKYKVWPGVADSGYGMQMARKKRIDPDSVRARLAKRLGEPVVDIS